MHYGEGIGAWERTSISRGGHGAVFDMTIPYSSFAYGIHGCQPSKPG